MLLGTQSILKRINRPLQRALSMVGPKGLCSPTAACATSATARIRRSITFRYASRAFSATTVNITYVEADGTEKTVEAKVGQHLLDVAHENNVELEGACGGELACSTCHLIFPKDIYDTLPEKDDEEEDMLDLSCAVTETYVEKRFILG